MIIQFGQKEKKKKNLKNDDFEILKKIYAAYSSTRAFKAFKN